MSIHNPIEVVGSFSGPHQVGVDYSPCNWDSVSLELHGDGHFSLGLWHFYESWDYIPEDVEDDGVIFNGPAQDEDDVATGVNGVPLQRANHPREVEEVRVTLRGCFITSKVVAVRLGGFHQQALNQLYTEDSCQLIGGMPTWWSADGLHFFYFDVNRNHWRANSVRLIGGAGVRAVAPNGRRAGNGIAHSASVKQGEDPTAAFTHGVGWYEVDSNDTWHLRSIDVFQDHADVLDFHADDIMTEERHVRGVEGGFEEKLAAGPVAFHGWHKHGNVRLVMPPLPDRINMAAGEEAPMETIQMRAPMHQNGSNLLGDPDSLILRPHVAARL